MVSHEDPVSNYALKLELPTIKGIYLKRQRPGFLHKEKHTLLKKNSTRRISVTVLRSKLVAYGIDLNGFPTIPQGWH